MAETVADETQGAVAGEQATPEAAGSEVNLDELVASLDSKGKPAEVAPAVDDDFVKKLESLDPGALPEALRRKLEAPFLSNMTKKTTDFDQERQRYLAMIEKLSNQGQPQQAAPGVDEQELLRQKIAEGDIQAIEQLVDRRFDAKYGRDMQNIQLDSAYRTALSQFPEAQAMEPQIAETLKANPGVAWVIRSVTPRDPALAGTLIAGVAKNLAYDKMAAQLKETKDSIPKLVKQGIEEYQRRIGKLPSSTTQSGKTPTGEASEAPKSLRDAMEEAWNEQVRG